MSLFLPILIVIATHSFCASFSNEETIKGNAAYSVKAAGQDVYYKKALEMLENRKMYISKRIFDPEAKKNKEIKIPDYKSAFELLVKSVKKFKNPFAAKKGYEILLSGLLSEKHKRNYPLFARTMYEHGMCQGYIAWGDVLAKGIYHKVDLKEAKEVYRKGIDVCRKNGKSWQVSIIGTRYGQINGNREK